jgi:hypothetical protein
MSSGIGHRQASQLPLPRLRHGGKGAIVIWLAISLLAIVAISAPAGSALAKGTRPTSVTFKYHAFGNGSPVTLSFDEQKNGQSFSQSSVADQGTFTVTTGGQTGVDMLLGSYNIDVHTSCSAPIGIGMVFNDDVEKPAPDAPSIQGYNGPTAIEIVDMNPRNACGNTSTPPPSNTPTPTPTPTCPGGGPMPSSGVCATHTPTPTPSKTPSTTPSRTPTPPPDLRCPVGTTKFTINGTNDASYTDFTITVTVTYSNQRSVDFTANRGIRELLVAGNHGVNRYQFDPPIKLGNRFQEPGGGVISKTVFCYVNPAPTPTKTPTPPCNCATPTPTPPPCACPTPTPPCSCTTTVVNDTFTRERGDGWGSANTGGAYTMFGTSGSFSVDGSAGHMLVGAGLSRGALLNSVSRRDVDIKFRVKPDKVSMGGKNFVYAVARRIGSNEYRPRLIFNPDGTVSVSASILVNGVETALGTPVVAPGVGQNAFVWFRAQVTGSNPTTIKVKAWQSGSSEPSGWQFTTTNSNSACQSAGGVGLRAYVSSSATNGPIDWKFDDYKVIGL